jgi:hypothetical protein
MVLLVLCFRQLRNFFWFILVSMLHGNNNSFTIIIAPKNNPTMEHFTVKIIEKIGSHFLGSFMHGIAARVQRKKALAFYAEYVNEIRRREMGLDCDDAIRQYLERIEDDEKLSEILFTAYRSVAFSRSKLIGSRIIAYLTAQMVHDGRVATDEEELVFLASEELTDKDFLELSKYMIDNEKNWKDNPHAKGFIISFHSETIKDFTPGVANVGPLNLNMSMGYWAGKLERIGLISQNSILSKNKTENASHLNEGLDVYQQKYHWEIVIYTLVILYRTYLVVHKK